MEKCFYIEDECVANMPEEEVAKMRYICDSCIKLNKKVGKISSHYLASPDKLQTVEKKFNFL